jgi:hypothetical protein
MRRVGERTRIPQIGDVGGDVIEGCEVGNEAVQDGDEAEM